MVIGRGNGKRGRMRDAGLYGFRRVWTSWYRDEYEGNTVVILNEIEIGEAYWGIMSVFNRCDVSKAVGQGVTLRLGVSG